MRISRLHVSMPLKVGDTIELNDELFHYANRVLRLRAGDAITLFNGDGGEYGARFTAVSKRNATLEIEAFRNDERCSPVIITCAAGVTRGDKMDVTIRRCTELGISRFQPLTTERSGVSFSGAERLAKRREHWQHVAVAACEQCGQNRIPTILPPRSLPEWLGDSDAQSAHDLRLVFDPAAPTGWSGLPARAGCIAVLTGSEGGLSNPEVEAARTAGFIAVRLGPRILRAETAAIAAAALVQARFGDLLD
ncbi:MAG: 16S rRNA (uracil(1498)-N(3))-methyltransferase [Pseudomonadota bacterium]